MNDIGQMYENALANSTMSRRIDELTKDSEKGTMFGDKENQVLIDCESALVVAGKLQHVCTLWWLTVLVYCMV